MADLANKELIGRITTLYENGSADKSSLHQLLQSIPSDNDATASSKLSSIKDNNLSVLNSSRYWSDASDEDKVNAAIALELATRSTNTITDNSEFKSSTDRDNYINSKIKEYSDAISTSNNPSTTAREITDASVSYAHELSRVSRASTSKSYQSSELTLASKMSALMSNNLTQSLGRASLDAMSGKFNSASLLKNISNDLPWGLGKITNTLLRNYDYSSYEVVKNQVSNPNKPNFEVDGVVCWIKDISTPGSYTPPFEIIHHPSGFTDSISHNYSSDTIIGRTSPLMGYNYSSRSVSFDFMVHEDFQPFGIEETVNFLKGMTYPSYDFSTNKLTPPKVLMHVGQFSEIVVIDSVSVAYQENPVREGKYIVANISVSGEVVPPTDGYLEYKEKFYKNNSYAGNRAFSNRGAGIVNTLTDKALTELGNQIRDLLAPIDTKVNEVGAQILDRGSELVRQLLNKTSNMLGVDLSPINDLLNPSKPSGESGKLLSGLGQITSNSLVTSRNGTNILNSFGKGKLGTHESWSGVRSKTIGNRSEGSWLPSTTKDKLISSSNSIWNTKRK